MFGSPAPVSSRGRLVALFVQELQRQAQAARGAADLLVDELEERAERLGLDIRANRGRLHTARLAVALLSGLLASHGDVEVIRHLARAELDGSPERVGRSIRSADEVVRALRTAGWDTFDLVAGLGEPWSDEAARIFASLRDAGADDELTTPLGPVLNRSRQAATDLLRRATRRPHTPAWPDHSEGTLCRQPARTTQCTRAMSTA